MTKTLLNGVNEVLQRVGIIDSGNSLSTLTDSGRQVYIDLAVQIWNEAIDRHYDLIGEPLPKEARTRNITLVSGQREYNLPSDLVEITFPMIDTTNGQYILEYPGGYEQMRINQPQPSAYTGLPLYAIVNPNNDKLRMDRSPTSDDAGKVYELYYHRDNNLTDKDQLFPFSDAVFRAFVPVVAEEWKARKNRDFNAGKFLESAARAASFATRKPRRRRW